MDKQQYSSLPKYAHLICKLYISAKEVGVVF